MFNFNVTLYEVSVYLLGIIIGFMLGYSIRAIKINKKKVMRNQLMSKYPDLKLKLTSTNLIYYIDSISFLEDDLLYDLYTYIDKNKLGVTIFFDSERDYV